MSARNYGLSSRETAGGVGQSRGSHHALDTHQRNLNSIPPLPSGSIASSPPLERRGFFQAALDVLAVAGAVVVICVTAISIPVSLFILLFVRL